MGPAELRSGIRRIRRWSRRITARTCNCLIGNADPAGQIGNGHQSAGEEEAQHRKNPDNRYIPSVGLRQPDADTGDLTAGMRSDQWPARHGRSKRKYRTAVGAETRAYRQRRSALRTINSHDPLSSEDFSSCSLTTLAHLRFRCPVFFCGLRARFPQRLPSQGVSIRVDRCILKN